MIQYDKDFVTLYYIDANGTKVSQHPTNGAEYGDLLVIRDAQLQAIRENETAATNYKGAITQEQYNINIGRPSAGFQVPAKPLQKVVSNTGQVTFVPFVPAFPELVIPKPIPSGPIAAPSIDKQAIMYNMILAMFRKMFPEA